jgi:hypothetical protein
MLTLLCVKVSSCLTIKQGQAPNIMGADTATPFSA